MSSLAQVDVIIGQKLTGVGRVLNMGVFAFGPDVQWSDGEQSRTGSKYAIHIQCPFRITRNNRMLVGSDDINVSADKVANFVADRSDAEGLTAYDLIAERIVRGTESSPLIVSDLTVRVPADLRIVLTDGVVIEAFLAGSRPSEAWRFIERGGEHLVFP